MCEVTWKLSVNKKEFQYVLAVCGIWQAELARDVYSKGQVMILSENQQKEAVPDYLGQTEKVIPQPNNLMTLIDEVSRAMVKAFGCEKVYLASLNESENLKLHFRLTPKYKEHNNFLSIKNEDGEDENDGFKLLAKLRDDFVSRSKTGNWGDMPPKSDEKFDHEWNPKWCRYADSCLEKVKKIQPWQNATTSKGETQNYN